RRAGWFLCVPYCRANTFRHIRFVRSDRIKPSTDQAAMARNRIGVEPRISQIRADGPVQLIRQRGCVSSLRPCLFAAIREIRGYISFLVPARRRARKSAVLLPPLLSQIVRTA